MQKLTVEVEMDWQEVKVHEAIAQEECAEFTVEVSATRICKVKESSVLQDTRTALQSSLTATTKEMKSLPGCSVWLLQVGDAWKEVRAGDIDSLKNNEDKKDP